jgi:glycosyltransferase involved in cell wall biosynthesis
MQNISETSLVSIIMNCYNGEMYLRDAIDSVLAQTYRNWELVFWDNQSTDNSADIVNRYNDERIRYYYSPKHTALYEARNYAIENASGEFIAFLDVDDWWMAEKLEKQIPLFNDSKVGLVYGNYRFDNEIKNTHKILYNYQLPSGMILNSLLEKYVVGLLTIVVRKSAFYSIDKQFDSTYNIIGDFDFVIRLSSRYEIDCVQEVIATYRYHGENISIKKRDDQIVELERWIIDMKLNQEVYKQKMFSRQEEQLLFLKVMNLIYSNERVKALKLATSMPSGKIKIKSVIVTMLPAYFLLKLQS